MGYKTVYTEVEIDTDEILGDVSTEDLIAELNSRQGHGEDLIHNLIAVIYNKKRTGKDYSKDLDELIFQYLGKVV